MPASDPIALRLGHSPDPDDAFMWWPLVPDESGRAPLETGRYRFETIAQDIEELNELSESAALEITAISCAQYPLVSDRYALTACGASMGDGYGPKVISRTPMSVDDLRTGSYRLAIPGRRTSAWTALRLLLGITPADVGVLPFDAILPAVTTGEFDAGLIIHEQQIGFEAAGLHLVVDLGQRWQEKWGTPLPLGVNVIRRDLDDRFGPGTMQEVAEIQRRSVEFALAHRPQALAYALQFGRGVDPVLADRFIAMYVNKWSLQFGPEGERAVGRFLAEAADAGLLPRVASLDVIGAG